MEELVRRLTRLKGASGFKALERHSVGQELYLIGRRVEMRRSTEVRIAEATLYRDFREGGRSFRGSASAEIYPEHTPEEAQAILERTLASAGHVRNDPYPLARPAEAEALPERGLGGLSPREVLEAMAGALFEGEAAAEGAAWLNSAELFLSRVEIRLASSAGLEAHWGRWRGHVELIAEAGGRGAQVEQYRGLSFEGFAPERLSAETRALLERCHDRAQAAPTPALARHTVILTGEPVSQFFDYYLTQSAAQSVYRGVSRRKPGEALQGVSPAGDAISLSLVPYLEDSPASAPRDSDGFPLRAVRILEGGVLKRHWGRVRFCHYLQCEPTGALANVSVEPGSRKQEQMRADPYLEVVSFSDFRSDAVTGDFGGEIRLAYFSDGRSRRPVTGGSVTGNVRELHGRLYLSRETRRDGTFQGPASVQLFGVRVAGS